MHISVWLHPHLVRCRFALVVLQCVAISVTALITHGVAISMPLVAECMYMELVISDNQETIKFAAPPPPGHTTSSLRLYHMKSACSGPVEVYLRSSDRRDAGKNSVSLSRSLV